VRPRSEHDLPACEELARIVHEHDGYPAFQSRNARTFLASPGALNAWVAEIDGVTVGHVALHPTSSEEVMVLASTQTGLRPDQLGVVARLFVSPTARGQGAGRSLVATAVDQARQRGLCPVLDVDISLHAAIRLYEANGWLRAGTVNVRLPNGTSLQEAVYTHSSASRPVPKTP
jgi:GNAT superfamily N-acetyltransferase